MARTREVFWSDIDAAAKARDPQLAALVIQYMGAPDPAEDRDEEADPAIAVAAQPDGAWTLPRLRRELNAPGLAHKSEDERRAARRAAWDALLSAKHPPPRLKLGGLLVELYEAGDEPGLDALREILRHARIGWGFWQGLKRVYKLAEERHDAPMLGLIAWRLDTFTTSANNGEVGRGTLIYMRRRAWRYLRELGAAVPESYPEFAVEVLRHYEPRTNFYATWVVSQIWGHQRLIGLGSGSVPEPAPKMKEWAYPEAWKRSAEPLLRLLEHAAVDPVCAFAIIGLKEAFEDVLRDVKPEWLMRLGRKSLPSVHDFVVHLLRESPRFHIAKLEGLGLEPMVVEFLASPSVEGRVFALSYVRAQSVRLPVETLVRLASLSTLRGRTSGDANVAGFAAEQLEKLSGKDIGLPALCALIANGSTRALAEKKLRESFTVRDVGEAEFVALLTGGGQGERFIDAWYAESKLLPPASFLLAALRDPRVASGGSSVSHRERRVLNRLAKRKASDIGVSWIQDALVDPKWTSIVSGWVTQGKLQGANVDVAWFKELIARPKLRSTALAVLGNAKWVQPTRLEAGWLLGLLRHPDAALRSFARRHLLEHFVPADLVGHKSDSWSLLAPGQPEAVREFAMTFLRAHHPELGPTVAEARDLGVKPSLTPEAFGQGRVVPLTDDPRADVRRFAGELVGVELRRWDDASLAYQLAQSPFPETRKVGGEALLLLGDEEVAPEQALPVAWLQVDAVFALAESDNKSTREVALTLIRRHYDRLGGADRLAWLMESPDREVRLFAVRLLWEKHRAKAAQAVAARGTAVATTRFEAPDALRNFLRVVLFGLPPGRMERRVVGETQPDRALPSSIAKQRLVGVLRDFALEDAGFAAVVQPVFETFLHSQARGERDACLAALVAMRQAHPSLQTALPSANIEIQAPRRTRFGHPIPTATEAPETA